MGETRRFARSRLRWLAVSVVAASILPVVPAHAACDDEQLIFVYSQTPNYAYGNRSRNYIRDRPLDNFCTADAESHSTAFVDSALSSDFVEVGWVERWAPNFNHKWNVFWEAKVAGVYLGGFDYGSLITCCRMARFKVNQTSSTIWQFWVDPLDNGSYTLLNTLNVGFTYGTVLGETGRRAPQTNVFDHHQSLLWAQYSGGSGWGSWPNNGLAYDNIPGWHYEPYAVDNYQVEQD